MPIPVVTVFRPSHGRSPAGRATRGHPISAPINVPERREFHRRRGTVGGYRGAIAPLPEPLLELHVAARSCRDTRDQP